jgi:hypothetical protein
VQDAVDAKPVIGAVPEQAGDRQLVMQRLISWLRL